MLTLDNRALRDAASAAPYEFIEILVNEQTYGGGGIFNDQATASVDSAFADYVFVHEFGHHFAALADEYYTSDVAYETGAPQKHRAVGAERHRAARSGDAEVARPGRRRHAAADAVGQGAFEEHSREHPGTAPGDPRAERAGGGDGRALPRGARLGRRSSSAAMTHRRQRSARSKARPTRRKGSTGRRPTASCSRAIRVGFCRSAGARSADHRFVFTIAHCRLESDDGG